MKDTNTADSEPGQPLGLALTEGLGAGAEALCACKDRPASQCPGEWEPGCDLGANERFACGAPPVWMPIETAPRNTRVLVTRFPATTKPPIDMARFSTAALRRHEFPWRVHCNARLRYRPTHWIPLPAPPEAA